LGEFVQFLNNILTTSTKQNLSEDLFIKAIEQNKFNNIKGHVANGVLMIQELKNLGYDWVIMNTTMDMENEIVYALKGR
jgi:hypothetical protein